MGDILDTPDDGDVSSNMSKFDGGFASALTDEEYFLVMGSIGIVALDEDDNENKELTAEEAKRKIDAWFSASPERQAMPEK